MHVRGNDGVWRRTEPAEDLDYSDGDASEEHVLSVVRSAEDLSSLSEELHAAAVDWPSRYHLSRQRHLIARPLGIRSTDRVLELGAGTGSITRYLGEIGAEVHAVEGSLRRARIAAERVRDLPNVQVFHDDVLAFDSGQKYDWVLLVGVLEYATRFIVAADPAVRLLEAVKGHLATGGRFAVAIENRLGLKYLAGFNEDHLGEPRVGVEGRYRAGDASTYSRQELTGVIESAGLELSALLLPFPDYKLPTVIMTGEAVQHPALAKNLLMNVRSSDYSSVPLSSFDDRLVRHSIAGSDVLIELANSFLAVGTARGSLAWQAPALFWNYSLASRQSQFACETTLVRNEDGQLRIIKHRLDGSTEPRVVGDTGVVHRILEAPFSDGRSLLSLALDDLSRIDEHRVVDVIRACAQKFSSALRERLGTDREVGSAPETARGEFFDFVPRNIVIMEENSRADFIDDEWVINGGIRRIRILHRFGLDLAELVESVFPGGAAAEQVWVVLEEFGLTGPERESCALEESEFQEALQSRSSVNEPTSFQAVSATVRLRELVAEVAQLRDDQQRLMQERDRIESERYWWEDQFRRLRSRRSVGLLLRLMDRLERLRRKEPRKGSWLSR